MQGNHASPLALTARASEVQVRNPPPRNKQEILRRRDSADPLGWFHPRYWRANLPLPGPYPANPNDASAFSAIDRPMGIEAVAAGEGAFNT